MRSRYVPYAVLAAALFIGSAAYYFAARAPSPDFHRDVPPDPPEGTSGEVVTPAPARPDVVPPPRQTAQKPRPVDPSAPNLPGKETPSAGQPLKPLSPSSSHLAGHNRWPGSPVFSVWEAPISPHRSRRISILQPPDLPYPVRVEEVFDDKGELVERTEIVANRFVVKATGSAAAELQAYARATGVQLRSIAPVIGLYRVEMDTLSPDGVPLAIEAISQEVGGLDYAEPDYIRRASIAPNDPKYADGTLWGMHNTGQDSGTVDADIDALEGWDIRTSAPNIVVGVIDTGVNYTHEDLTDNMWVNPGEDGFDALGRDKRTNLIDDDGNGYVDDVFGINAITLDGDPLDDHNHGSHCAGTIAARGNNNVGVVGVAWEAQIMGLKFLSASGSGAVSDAIVCMQYAIDQGADLTSNSWGGGGASQGMKDIIAAAAADNQLFIAAAGNDSSDNDQVDTYPSNYEVVNVIAVAAVDREDDVASFSNTGSGMVDIGAPGVSILSCFSGDSDAYGTYNGTSMATPHVAGAAALLYAEFSGSDYMGIKNRLLKSSRATTALETTVVSKGFLNLYDALQTTSDAPYNDDFANAHEIVDEAEAIRANNVHASAEAGEPSHEGVSGSSVWFAYEAISAGQISVSTHGSDFDTVVAVYTGSTIDGLSPVASNDDSGGLTTSLASFWGEAGTMYYIAIAGKGGAEGFIRATFSGPPREDLLANAIEFSALPFGFSQNNSNATAEPDEPAHAGNPASGSLWMKLNVGVGGKARIRSRYSDIDTVLAVYTAAVSNPAMTDLVPLISNDDGFYGDTWSEVSFDVSPGTDYWIAVDGKNGERGSISVSGAFKPVNDDFEDAIPVTTDRFSTLIDDGAARDSTRELGEPNHDNADSTGSLWWSFTPPAAGDYWIRTDGNTALGLYTGTSVNGLTLIAADENDGSVFGASRILLENADPGTTYRVAFALRPDVIAWGPQLSIEPRTVVENDNLESATVIPGNVDYTFGERYSSSFDLNNATTETGEDLTHAAEGYTAWYEWTPSESGDYILTGQGSIAGGFSVIVYELTGSTADGLQHSDLTYRAHDYFSGYDGGSFTYPLLQFAATAGTTYYIQIGARLINWLDEVTFSLYRYEPPVNDDLADALEVTGLFVQREFYNYGATREVDEPDHASDNWYYNDFRPHWVDDGYDDGNGSGFWSVGPNMDRAYATLWFKWTPGAEHIGRRTAASAFGSSESTAIQVYEVDRSITSPTYADIEPILPLHPNPDRVPQGATTNIGFQSRADTHDLFDSDTNYPGMYPPDPDYNEAYPDNRDPNWRPGSSFRYAEGNNGEVTFIPETNKTYYIMMGNDYPDPQALLRLSLWQNLNDDLADAEVLTGTNVSVQTANFAATWEEDEPYHHVNGSGDMRHVIRAGTRSVWYEWTCPEDGIYTFDTYHSYFGWGGKPIPIPASDWMPDGQAQGGLVQLSIYTAPVPDPAMTDLVRIDCQTILDFNMNRNAKMAIECQAGTTYYIALDDVTLSGAWGFNGYLYETFFPKSEWCLRAIHTLNIKKGSLANDDIEDATVIPSDVNDPAFTERVYHEFIDLAHAWHEAGEPDHTINHPDYLKSAWWKWTAPTNGTYWIGAGPDFYHHECADRYSSVAGNDVHAPAVAVYTGPAANPTMGALGLVTNINSDGVRQNYSTGVTSFEATAGQTYYFAMGMEEHYRSFDSGAYQTGLQFGKAPANDNFTNATEVVGHIATVYGNNMGATEEQPAEPRIEPDWYYAGSTDHSVWWQWTAPGSGQTIISTYGSYIVNELGVYTGSSLDALTLIAFEEKGLHIDNRDTYEEKMDEATREVTFAATAGTTYHIKVNGSGWDRACQGPITLSITGQPGIPINPSDFTYARVNASRVDFSWTDNSFDESHFVIQRSLSPFGLWIEVLNTGEADVESGSDFNADQDYYYRLRAEGPGGVSDWVYAEDLPEPPVIIQEPVGGIHPTGSVVTLTVVATGPELAYQWYGGGSGVTSAPVANATNSQFATPPLATSTSYWVRVTNDDGSDHSRTAILTVDPGLLHYEGFRVPGDYTNNVDIDGIAGGIGWDGGWIHSVANTYQGAIASKGYTDDEGHVLQTTDGVMARHAIGGFYSLRRVMASAELTGTIYFSFYVERTAGVNHANWSVYVRNQSGTLKTVLIGDKVVDGLVDVTMELDGGGTLSTNSSVSWDQPNFFVGRVVTGDGGNFTLWINPDDLTDVEIGGAEAIITLTDDVTGSIPGLRHFCMEGTGDQSGFLDEIRIGQTLSSVVPVVDNSTPLEITNWSLMKATAGSVYSEALTAAGGATSNYLWSILSGQPAWLNLSSNTGALSGIPDDGVPYRNTLTVQVADGSDTASAQFTLFVNGTGNIDPADWAVLHGLTQPLATTDSNQNGVVDLIEWALGGDPKTPGLPGFPSIALDPLNSEYPLLYILKYRKGLLHHYQLQLTGDLLGNWGTPCPILVSEPDIHGISAPVDAGGGFEEIGITLERASSDPMDEEFIRLLIQEGM